MDMIEDASLTTIFMITRLDGPLAGAISYVAGTPRLIRRVLPSGRCRNSFLPIGGPTWTGALDGSREDALERPRGDAYPTGFIVRSSGRTHGLAEGDYRWIWDFWVVVGFRNVYRRWR